MSPSTGWEQLLGPGRTCAGAGRREHVQGVALEVSRRPNLAHHLLDLFTGDFSRGSADRAAAQWSPIFCRRIDEA